MKKFFLFVVLFTLSFGTLAQVGMQKPIAKKVLPKKSVVTNNPNTENEGIFATIITAKGNIVLKLEFQKTPITVANFVSLAEGTNKQVKTELKGKLFYNNLKFHRVIKDFMIQGGDPLGSGAGDPGYKFKDEITDLVHDKPGILSMANSGPNSNGSQFFITHKETSWLNGVHTVFGKVVSGQNIVDLIAQDDVISAVLISRKGAAAKAFDASKIFNDYFLNKDKEEQTAKAKAAAAAQASKDAYLAKYGNVVSAKLASLKALKDIAKTTESGLQYVLVSSNGKKPINDATVYVHYSGFLEDGSLFQSSIEDVSKTFGTFDQKQADQNGYAPFPFKAGSKTGLIPGFLEGLNMMAIGDKMTMFIPSKIGYGNRAMGNAIPANSNLIFEVELMETVPVKK